MRTPGTVTIREMWRIPSAAGCAPSGGTTIARWRRTRRGLPSIHPRGQPHRSTIRAQRRTCDPNPCCARSSRRARAAQHRRRVQLRAANNRWPARGTARLCVRLAVAGQEPAPGCRRLSRWPASHTCPHRSLPHPGVFTLAVPSRSHCGSGGCRARSARPPPCVSPARCAGRSRPSSPGWCAP